MNSTPFRYREEILKPFFKFVKSGESFYIVGAPSVGKTRLMDFIMGDDFDALRSGLDVDHDSVKIKYLGNDAASKTWLVRVDMNRMRREDNWEFLFYELLLNTLLLVSSRCEQTEENKEIEQELAALDSRVIESKDILTAHRFFEMAVNKLCRYYGINLCFLFDEFDETYKNMPREAFAQLRAIRDANKYRISYVLFLRDLPERIRKSIDNESFYELISRNMLGMGPFSMQDTFHIVGQLETRYEYELAEEKREWLCVNSGGHPGLIQALFTLLKDHHHAAAHMQDLEWFARQDTVREEFRKIYAGLLKDEQAGLRQIADDQTSVSPAIGKLLLAKGLIKSSGGRMVYFTPLFGYWLK
jgi:hypothetical protein